MDNLGLPLAFNRLHFLKLDLKSTKDDSSGILKYCLKNHFNSIVAQIEGKVVVHKQSENELHSHFELVATEPITNKRKNENPNPSNLFQLIIRKRQDGDAKAVESGFGCNCDAIISTTSDSTLLCCELLSNKGQSLSHINIMKDTRSSTCSYDVLERNGQGSLFQISRKQISENRWDVIINSLPPEQGISSAGAIARINVEDDKISLSMTPELKPITKLRLISIVLLMERMEVVENRKE